MYSITPFIQNVQNREIHGDRESRRVISVGDPWEEMESDC